MYRFLIAITLAAALLLAACGTDSSESDSLVETQDSLGTTSTSSPTPDDDTGQSQDAADASAADDGSAPADSDADSDSGGDSDASEPTAEVPRDAESLLAAASTQGGATSMRGAAVFEVEEGFELMSSFELDADGDLASSLQVPTGLDGSADAGVTTEVRFVDDVVYVRAPLGDDTGGVFLEDAWFVVEQSAIGDSAGDDMDLLGEGLGSVGGLLCVFPDTTGVTTDGCDPLGAVQGLLQGAGEVELIGSEQVRDVATSRVRLVASLLDQLGDMGGFEMDESGSDDFVFDAEGEEFFADGLEELFSSLDTGLEMNAWIDDQGRIRRFAFDLATLFGGFGLDGAQAPSNRVTFEFYDFDADIDVEAPAADALVYDPALLGVEG